MTDASFPALAIRTEATIRRAEALLFEIDCLATDIQLAEGDAPAGQDRAGVYAARRAVCFAAGGLRRELASLAESHRHLIAVSAEPAP